MWHALQLRARRERTTISDLVRRAARERYLSKLDQRREAMLAVIGIREDRPEFRDPEAYIRGLRRSGRIERLAKL